MNNFKLFLLYGITLLVYTQGYWERFTPIPIQLVLEFFVWLIALSNFRPRVGWRFFIVIFVYGLFASFCTQTIIDYLKYIRFFIYFYIIYSVLWNTYFTIPQFRRFLRFIIWMVLIQGIASLLNMYVLGGRAEYNVGCMSSLGGTTATSFPLFIFSVALLVYFFNKSRNKRVPLMILVMTASVFLMVYSSGKRAAFFLIPAFLLALSLICLFVTKKQTARKLWGVALVVLLFSPLYFFAATDTAGFNYDLSGNESKLQIIKNMFEYADEYENAETESGLTIGRSNTSQVILGDALTSYKAFFVGRGFGSLKDEMTIDQAGIGYGIVGMTRDIFSGGLVFGLFVAIFFIFLFFKTDYQYKDIFSSLMRFVILTVFVTLHFFYSSDFTISLKIDMMLSLMLCYLNSNNYSHIKEYYRQYLYHE